MKAAYQGAQIERLETSLQKAEAEIERLKAELADFDAVQTALQEAGARVAAMRITLGSLKDNLFGDAVEWPAIARMIDAALAPDAGKDLLAVAEAAGPIVDAVDEIQIACATGNLDIVTDKITRILPIRTRLRDRLAALGKTDG